MDTFGTSIRNKRLEKGLILREVAALVGIDQALISKYEKGERFPSRNQVMCFAEKLGLEAEQIIIAWLSDKVAKDLYKDELGEEALKVAEAKVQYLKKANK